MLENVNTWSNRPQDAERRADALVRCEKQNAANEEGTRTVIMCLSLPDLDAASDCLVHEAVRSNLGTCTGSAEEVEACHEMLLSMVEPLKEDFRRSIMDGSLLE